MSFEFPDCHIGDPVEISADATQADVTYGIVLRPKSSSADVLAYYDGGQFVRRDCLHADDPRVAERPDMFLDGDRGVFRFTSSELLRRSIAERLDGLETTLDELTIRLVAKEKKPKK